MAKISKPPKLDTTYGMRHEMKMPSAAEVKDLEAKLNKTKAQIKAAFVKAQISASGQMERELPVYLTTAMLSNVWSWPRETKRKNGETAGMTRDITDLGTLARSLKINTKNLVTKTSVTIEYTAPHALLVHGDINTEQGRYISRSDGSSYYYPPRPWIRAVVVGGYPGIEKYPFDTVFKSHINEKLGAKSTSSGSTLTGRGS